MIWVNNIPKKETTANKLNNLYLYICVYIHTNSKYYTCVDVIT